MDDEEVPGFWKALGLPGLIDVHVHFLPERVLQKVWAYFDTVPVPRLGVEWPITYRQDEQQRVQTLRQLGVRAFPALVYPHRPDMAEWLTRWACDFADAVPECLATGTFYPETEAPRYVRRALEQGVCIFKSHVQVGGYDPADGDLDEVWGLLAEAGTPIICHCGSGPEPGTYTGPAPIRRLLERHPRLTLVVAHMGMSEYAEFLELAMEFPRVYLDTTMVFTEFSERIHPYPPELVPRLRDVQDRVLLGTDFPNIPYSYGTQLEALAGLELGRDWLRAVCFHNSARLLQIAV